MEGLATRAATARSLTRTAGHRAALAALFATQAELWLGVGRYTEALAAAQLAPCISPAVLGDDRLLAGCGGRPRQHPAGAAGHGPRRASACLETALPLAEAVGNLRKVCPPALQNVVLELPVFLKESLPPA